MIKVAFWYDRPSEYSGGLNYLRNLLFAISKSNDSRIDPYVFFGTRVDETIIDSFRPFATVKRTKVLDRWSLPWIINKVFIKLGSIVWVERILNKYEISIISHAANIHSKRSAISIVGWIPDFQYLHLPEYFPKQNALLETRRLQTLILGSDIVILSSYAALNDYHTIAPLKSMDKSKVLQFVSQPNTKNILDNIENILCDLESRYSFKGRYFFLPNQFWRHKNHMIVFDAVRSLKDNGVDVLLLCTGNLFDYRVNSASHAECLKEYVRANGLQENIKILGLIDYDDVLVLLKNCVALINPSFFEGWSSTVEEAKSMGKMTILSNIPVHIEQNPINSKYFSPNDVKGLVSILNGAWEEYQDEEVESLRVIQAQQQLEYRTISFGRKYIEIVDSLGMEKL